MEENLQKRREKLLRPVIQWLETGAPHVEKPNIARFSMSVGVDCDKEKGPVCGTTCCIAGAICQFNAPFEITKLGDWWKSPDWFDVKKRATELLDITEEQANWLFVEYSEEWLNVKPKEAATVLRHFLETGEVDWSITAVPRRYGEEP